MQTEWEDLMEKRFTPAQAERMAGVSTALQRKWVQLHFSTMPDSDWQWEASVGGHRRFTWAGIQMLVFFRDVATDLGTRHGAQGSVEVAHYESGRSSSEFVPQSHLFETDFRNYEAGDLFLWRSLVDRAPEGFQTAVSRGVERLLASEWSARLYLYNISAMQRNLVSHHDELRSDSPTTSVGVDG